MFGKFSLLQGDMGMERSLLYPLCYRAGSDGVDWEVIMPVKQRTKKSTPQGSTELSPPLRSVNKNQTQNKRSKNGWSYLLQFTFREWRKKWTQSSEIRQLNTMKLKG